MNSPGMQSVQVPAEDPPHPSFGALVTSQTGHCAHVGSPVLFWYLPSAHPVHSEPPAAATVPTGHGVHAPCETDPRKLLVPR